MRLLFVDDDSEFCETAAHWFLSRGHDATAVCSAKAALEAARRKCFDVGVLDLRMPATTGLSLLRQLKRLGSETEFLLLTGKGTVESAVAALKLGAFDYLQKPCRLEELECRCRLAWECCRLRRENAGLRSLQNRNRNGEMIGRSNAMLDIFRLIERTGPSDKPVLIEGESGTGKELVARALHRASRRSHHPIITINCAALPEQLLESELFGHEKGAFTGAVAMKIGLFETADGGTLFIDEVGELALPLQAKLLRALEDGSFRRVGSIQERKADVRMISATNRNLSAEVAAGRFREDLYYRINVLSISLPPLRERKGDIPLLLQSLLQEHWTLDGEARTALERYRWPGNIRQLRNVLERAQVLADNHLIRMCDLPAEVIQSDSCRASIGFRPSSVPTDNLDEFERDHVLAVLSREGGNKTRAARALGINRRTLYRMLDRFDLSENSTQGGNSSLARPR